MNMSPKERLKLIVGSLLFAQSSMVIAGSLSGPTDSHDVNSGDTAESWTVTNGATLNINPNGLSNAISLGAGSQLNTNGATILGQTSISESNANLNATTLTNTAGGALRITEDLLTPATSNVSISSSQLKGTTFGLAMVGNSVVNLSNSTVLSTTANSSAIRHFGGDLIITNSSVITGQGNGLTVRVDQNNLSGTPNTALDASILIDGSTVIGTTGSAIAVGQNSEADTTLVNIDVNNDSQLTGGNGNILSVAENSTANMRVNNSILTGNVVNEAGSTTNLTLQNNASITGTFTNVTSASIDGTSAWNVTGNSSVVNLTNNGTVAFSRGDSGRTLTVNGNYTGNNGLLVFNTVLSDDSSQTDRMVVAGDTSGNTNVRVNNLGGSGNQTLHGIELINVQGNSDGTFTQQGRIVAGVYEYHLQRGDGNNNGNWYLSSKQDDDSSGGDNGGSISPVELTLRPEAGSYLANLAAANQMFVMSMDDRLGAMQDGNSSGLWIRNSGGHIREHDRSGQLKTQANRYTIQIGGDLAQLSTNEDDRINLGLMAGYGYSSSNTDSNVNGYRSSGSVHGYSLGIYGTWFANATDKTGLYGDAWAQYGWFDNSVNGEELASESYRSHGLTISLEAGYVLPMLKDDSISVYLQPKGQLIWMGVKADDHREANGTWVMGEGNDNVQSRLGLRAYVDLHTLRAPESTSALRPFAEVNWVHNAQNYGVSMDDVTIDAAGTQNLTEVKIGLEGVVNTRLGISGGVAQRTGTNSYSDTAVALEVKYHF